MSKDRYGLTAKQELTDVVDHALSAAEALQGDINPETHECVSARTRRNFFTITKHTAVTREDVKKFTLDRHVPAELRELLVEQTKALMWWYDKAQQERRERHIELASTTNSLDVIYQMIQAGFTLKNAVQKELPSWMHRDVVDENTANMHDDFSRALKKANGLWDIRNQNSLFAPVNIDQELREAVHEMVVLCDDVAVVQANRLIRKVEVRLADYEKAIATDIGNGFYTPVNPPAVVLAPKRISSWSCSGTTSVPVTKTESSASVEVTQPATPSVEPAIAPQPPARHRRYGIPDAGNRSAPEGPGG